MVNFGNRNPEASSITHLQFLSMEGMDAPRLFTFFCLEQEMFVHVPVILLNTSNPAYSMVICARTGTMLGRIDTGFSM